jgi:hypothetical protein
MTTNYQLPNPPLRHPAGIDLAMLVQYFPYNIGVAIACLWDAGLNSGAAPEGALHHAAGLIAAEIDRVAPRIAPSAGSIYISEGAPPYRNPSLRPSGEVKVTLGYIDDHFVLETKEETAARAKLALLRDILHLLDKEEKNASSCEEATCFALATLLICRLWSQKHALPLVWHPLTLLNGWRRYSDDFPEPKCATDGIYVYLRGVVCGGILGVITVLPPALHPNLDVVAPPPFATVRGDGRIIADPTQPHICLDARFACVLSTETAP